LPCNDTDVDTASRPSRSSDCRFTYPCPISRSSLRAVRVFTTKYTSASCSCADANAVRSAASCLLPASTAIDVENPKSRLGADLCSRFVRSCDASARPRRSTSTHTSVTSGSRCTDGDSVSAPTSTRTDAESTAGRRPRADDTSPDTERSASSATSDTVTLPADPVLPCNDTDVDTASRPSRSSDCRFTYPCPISRSSLRAVRVFTTKYTSASCSCADANAVRSAASCLLPASTAIDVENPKSRLGADLCSRFVRSCDASARPRRSTSTHTSTTLASLDRLVASSNIPIVNCRVRLFSGVSFII